MLTRRETEVLQLLALGLQASEVANALGLATPTVKMPQAVYKAASIGLIPLMRSDE